MSFVEIGAFVFTRKYRLNRVDAIISHSSKYENQLLPIILQDRLWRRSNITCLRCYREGVVNVLFVFWKSNLAWGVRLVTTYIIQKSKRYVCLYFVSLYYRKWASDIHINYYFLIVFTFKAIQCLEVK